MKQIRGDTKKYYFQRKDRNGDIITATPDSIYFTVKRDYTDTKVVFQKTIHDMTMDEDGTWHFTILPTDTNGLKYGNYVFDIQVTQDTVVTTIAKGVFTVEQEVTFVENEV